jgi:L-aspartate oxidase
VHGANRLASNSLLEGLVYGARAGQAMQEAPRAGEPGDAQWQASASGRTSPAGGQAATSSAQPATASPDLNAPGAIRDLMWRAAGLFRTREQLAPAVFALDAVHAEGLRLIGREGANDADDWRRFNLGTVASLIARAAIRREESRGGHFRADFPETDDLHWKVHLIDQKAHHA